MIPKHIEPLRPAPPVNLSKIKIPPPPRYPPEPPPNLVSLTLHVEEVSKQIYKCSRGHHISQVNNYKRSKTGPGPQLQSYTGEGASLHFLYTKKPQPVVNEDSPMIWMKAYLNNPGLEADMLGLEDQIAADQDKQKVIGAKIRQTWWVHLAMRGDFDQQEDFITMYPAQKALLGELISKQQQALLPMEVDQMSIMIDGHKPLITLTAKLGEDGRPWTRHFLTLDSFQPYEPPNQRESGKNHIAGWFLDTMVRKMNQALLSEKDYTPYLHKIADTILQLIQFIRHLRWVLPQLREEEVRTEGEEKPKVPRHFYTWYQFRNWGQSLFNYFFDSVLVALHGSRTFPAMLSEFDMYETIKQNLTNQELYILDHFVKFILQVKKASYEFVDKPSKAAITSMLGYFNTVDIESLICTDEIEAKQAEEYSYHPFLLVMNKLFRTNIAGFKTSFSTNLGILFARIKSEPFYYDKKMDETIVRGLCEMMKALQEQYLNIQGKSRIKTIYGTKLPNLPLDQCLRIQQAFTVDSNMYVLASKNPSASDVPNLLLRVRDASFDHFVLLWRDEDLPKVGDRQDCVQSGFLCLQNCVFVGWCYHRTTDVLQVVRITGLGGANPGSSQKSGFPSPHHLTRFLAGPDQRIPDQTLAVTHSGAMRLSRFRFTLGRTTDRFFSVRQVSFGLSSLLFLFEGPTSKSPEQERNVFELVVPESNEVKPPVQIYISQLWTKLTKNWYACDLHDKRPSAPGKFVLEKVVYLRRPLVFFFSSLNATIKEGSLGMKILMYKVMGKIKPICYSGIASYISLEVLFKRGPEFVKDYSLTDLNVAPSLSSMILVTCDMSQPRRFVLGLKDFKLSVVPVDNKSCHTLPEILGQAVLPSLQCPQSGCTYYLSKLQTSKYHQALYRIYYTVK